MTYELPIRVYWEDTDTCVLRSWTSQQRGVIYGHAAIKIATSGGLASAI